MKNNTRKLNDIAIPLIIQSICGVTMGFADQAMVGRISIYAFSAVGVVFSLLSLIAGIIGYTSVVFNIRGSNALGRKNENDFQDEFTATIILNIFIGLFFVIIILLFKKPILVFVFGFKDKMLGEAIKYTNIMSVYILLQALIFNLAAVFKIRKKTKYILIASTISSIVNLGLDYMIIFGKLGIPKLGTSGVAISTIIALMLNIIIYVYLCKDILKFDISKIYLYFYKIKICIRESLPFMGQEILEGSIFVLAINAIIARMGVGELSGYLILVQIIHIVLISMYMYGSATLTLISQADGEQNKELLSSLPRTSIFISMSIYITLSLGVLLFKDYIPHLITNDSETIALTSNLLIYMVIANVFNAISIIYKYALQAIGESKFVLVETAKINLLVLILMIVFVYILKFYIYGVFVALFVNYLLVYIIYKNKYTRCYIGNFESYQESL